MPYAERVPTLPSTDPATFKFEHPAEFVGTPMFNPSVLTGVVAPKKHLIVDVEYAPFLGGNLEHALSMVVEGGPLKTLFCKSEIYEAKATIGTKEIKFGTIAAGQAKEKTFFVKNLGQVLDIAQTSHTHIA